MRLPAPSCAIPCARSRPLTSQGRISRHTGTSACFRCDQGRCAANSRSFTTCSRWRCANGISAEQIIRWRWCGGASMRPIENADFAQKKRWRSMRRRPVTEIPSSDLSSNWLSRRACAEASCSAFLAPRRPTRPRRVDPRQQERQGAPHRAHPASWHGTGRAGSNYRARVSDVRQRLQAGVGARQAAAGGPWRTYTSTTFATRL